MIRRFLLAAVLSWPSLAEASVGALANDADPEMSLPFQLAQRAQSCKSVSSCREAVEMWCDGYRRADADGDGIPCENVCPNKKIVDEIREEIGC